MKVLEFPLTQITIAFIIGIIAANLTALDSTLLFGLLSLSSLILVVFYFIKKRFIALNLYFVFSVYIVSFLIGITTQITHTDTLQESHYTNNPLAFTANQEIELVLHEKLKMSAYSERYIAFITKINGNKTTGKVIINFPKQKQTAHLLTGSYIKLKTKLLPHKTVLNPNQFDYGKYLERKQIYAQLYTNDNTVVIGKKLKEDIWFYISNLRNTIISNLENKGFHKTELSVATALIMGQKQDISPDILQDYQYAGAIHILSVSGLHVGFLLLFMKFILKPIPNTKKASFIKLVITIALLLFFALLAGLSPSVVRSVTMFSFLAIGYYLKRKNSIYYTLIISMLLILLFQPSFLFDVGFQLSYLALFFILWLQPILFKLWKPKNKLLKYAWNLLTVAFAAQLGTLPLSIYYFHQFPGLFFITNLVVIPLLSIIMVLGIIVMSLAAFGYTPIILIKPFEWSIFYMNKIINTIASAEQFIIKDIPLNTALLISLYLAIITLTLWLQKPKFKQLAFTLIAIMILQLTYFQTQWNIGNQKEWIVYNSSRNTIITKRMGKDIAIYGNDSILKAKKDILKTYEIANFSTIISKEKTPNIFYFKNKKILLIDASGVYIEKSKPDIVVLTQSPKINLERLINKLKPSIIVADASNYKTVQELWKKTCEKQKIPFHATAEKGFYILK